MATVESKPAAVSTKGGAGIPVENPATGEVITTVPAMSGDEVKETVARARRAQPEWEAMGFDGRAKVLRRAQKWVLDNSDRIMRRQSRSSAAIKCATPLFVLCVSAPPSSSLLTSSCVTVLITSGPVTNM